MQNLAFNLITDLITIDNHFRTLAQHLGRHFKFLLHDRSSTLFTRQVQAGTVIFRQGERSTDLYVVMSGSVRLARAVKGRDDELEVVREGGVFGEMGVIRDAPRYATAIALEQSDLYRVDVDALRTACGDASPATSVVRALARRLHDTDERLAAVRGGS